MRGDRTAASGEAERVAARVRALLGTDEGSESDDNCSSAEDSAGLVVSGGDLAGSRRSAVHVGPTVVDRIASRLPMRLDPGRRGALAVGVAVLVAALVTGLWLMSARPKSVPVSATVPSVPGSGPLVGTDGARVGSSAPTAGGSSSAAPTRLVVDVAGKVRHPGVYRLPVGSRVDDALLAAGGPRGQVDLSSLNLAAPLVDGQQVAVGVPAAAGGPAGDSVGGAAPVAGASAGATGTIVALNSATLEQLESLPGVGPVLGQDILDYRNQHGSFTSIDQLKDVSGIGDVKYGEISPLVTL